MTEENRREGRTVWIYEEGDVLEIFDTDDEAHAWLEENAPEGAAFKHTLGPSIQAGTADENDVPIATE
jgi:hypothetical protein